MLVSLDTDLYIMTEHHGSTCMTSATTHVRVNMVNHSTASDGGESNCVIVYDDNTTQTRTVCYFPLHLGDEMSCAAVQMQSAIQLRSTVTECRY